ncbi:MAG: hypothetical protein AB1750_09895 [Chloroflexota bacterium]
MENRSALPGADRIGVLTAAVLLTFALTRLLPPAAVELRLTLGQFYLPYPVNLTTILTLLAGGLTATGMDWLLRGHPAFGKRPPVEHWLLPTLATLVAGVPLAALPSGLSWWITFAISGAVLTVVFIAEYIAVDPASPSYAAATVLLTALSFAVYLILLTALHSTGPRLVILIPSILAASGLVSLRALRLRLPGRWELAWGGGIALVSVQLAAALHYWPLSPIRFGLLLLGPLYALTSLAGSLEEKTPVRRAVFEPLSVLALTWALAALLP